jgi:AcrR family transcriptional regulator
MEIPMIAEKSDKKGHILESATKLIASGGLTDWSIEKCAREAKCAKGLVLHYFESKEKLLGEVARSLTAVRRSHWTSALSANGISGLDALWERLTVEADTQSARTLIELRLAQVAGARLSPAEGTELRRQLGATLEIPPEELPVADALEPLLEGYLLALLQGVSSVAVREAFFRYWISYVR